MKFTAPLLAAGLAASAHAASSSGTLPYASVVVVLETALPKSLLHLALSNPVSASKLISSEFAAGQTPAWFSHLPSDVKTYLVPVTTTPSAGAMPTMPSIPPMTMNSTANGTTTAKPAPPTVKKTTVAGSGGTTVQGITRTKSGPSPTTSSGKASPAAAGAIGVPTGMLGSALVGAVGLVGMLAL